MIGLIRFLVSHRSKEGPNKGGRESPPKPLVVMWRQRSQFGARVEEICILPVVWSRLSNFELLSFLGDGITDSYAYSSQC